MALGNRALLEELGIDPGPLAERAESLRADGQTVIFLAVDGEAAGLLGESAGVTLVRGDLSSVSVVGNALRLRRVAV